MYSETTLDHLHRPRNAGELDGADGVGEVTNPACGDFLKFSIRLDAAGRVAAARFKAFGCGGAIAASSLATEMAMGKTLAELARLDARAVDAALGGLPKGKGHCADLAADGVRAAARAAEASRQKKGLDEKRDGE